MTFEIKERDLLARIGRLKTKTGTVETPFLFPVINPAVQPIPPKNITWDNICYMEKFCYNHKEGDL